MHDAGAEDRGQAHHEDGGDGRPHQESGFVRQFRSSDRRRGASRVVERPERLLVTHADEGVGDDDEQEADRSADKHGRASVVGPELGERPAEPTAQSESPWCVPWGHGLLWGIDGDPFVFLLARRAPDRRVFRRDGGRNDAWHADGSGGEDDAVRHR